MWCHQRPARSGAFRVIFGPPTFAAAEFPSSPGAGATACVGNPALHARSGKEEGSRPAVAAALVALPHVQAGGIARPELDHRRNHPVSRPERRARNRHTVEARNDFRHAIVEGLPRRQGAALLDAHAPICDSRGRVAK